MTAFLFDLFRFGFALIFTGLHCVLMLGLFLEWHRDKRRLLETGDLPAVEAHTREAAPLCASPSSITEGSVPPLVSVIVSINNEETRMEELLRSLSAQDYPEAEYIFIDDRSTDGGPRMLRAFAGGGKQVTIITLAENPGPNHKQYALTKGIETARGNLLLFTDADCRVPPDWIRAMVRRMEDPALGIIIGPVFKRPGGRGFFHLYQCFDHAVRYMYLAASTGLGAAGGGFGNNLILRREALEAIGGYGAVPFSPTEDAALVSRMRSNSKYRIHSACGADTHVLTAGEKNWTAFINQTLRWNNGGLFSPETVTRINFTFLMITMSMGMLAIPLLPLFPSLWPLPVSVFLVMTANTIATLALFGVSLPKAGAAYVVQDIFTPLYFTFLTILGFCRFKTRWKEHAAA
ncbi:MAG: glycosyltransferase [Treponema sp.]|jgi:cellulose synthase/poly-beta-1,6-N-acetylglucosamine synthase-like glycosyltransferase|nr:glycosyltransferase [Treponema sp.]